MKNLEENLQTQTMDMQAYKDALSSQYQLLEDMQQKIIDLEQSNTLLENELSEHLNDILDIEKNNSLFSIIPANLIIMDGHAMIRSLNESALEFFNLQNKDVQDHSLRSILSSVSFKDFTMYFKAFKDSDDLITTIHYLELKDKQQFSLLLRKVINTNKYTSGTFIGSILRLNSLSSNFVEYLGNLAIEQMNEAIIIADADVKILRVNNAFTEITGYKRDEVLGRKPQLLKSGRHSKSFYKKMWDSIKQQGWWAGEIWNKRKNSQIYPQWLQINRLQDPISKKSYYVSVFSDITERKRSQEKLDNLAHYDPLTGLMNRHFMSISLQSLLERANENSGKIALLFMDLDHFKQVNDQYGHHEGDLILQEVSQRILACVRQNDIVSRIGGDEFVIILSRIEGYEIAQSIAKKIIDSIQQPFIFSKATHHLGASIGIAYYPSHGKNVKDLMRHADTAMYKAKNSGRSQYAVFDLSDEDKLNSYEHTKNMIHEAIENPQRHLQVWYQPVVNPNTNRVVSLEALVRIFDKENMLVPPDAFISVAEQERLIVKLGEAIYTMACSFVSENKKKGIQTPRIAINLSVIQLMDKDLFKNFIAISSKYNLHISDFSYEVTETSAMENITTILGVIDEFKAKGCTFMLDDFGTGYASLSQLNTLNVDTIKVDKSFTDLIENEDSSNKKVIKAILSMAKALEMGVVVEGVETQKQLDWLVKQGVEKIQGYYFSRPLEPTDLIEKYLK